MEIIVIYSDSNKKPINAPYKRTIFLMVRIVITGFQWLLYVTEG
jgi:hypothetical protein